MKRTTTAGGLVLGLALAGVALMPASGTLALLSDSASVQADVGAGSLGVGAVAGAPGLVLPMGGSGTVDVTTTGDLPWSLTVLPVGADGKPDCGVAAQLRVTSSLGSPSVPAGGCSVLVGEGSADVVGRIDVRRDGQPEPWAWTGSLRVTLQQRAGGFSDAVDVPLELLPPPGSGAPSAGPPPAGGPAAPGNGQGNGNGQSNGNGQVNGAAPGNGQGNGTRPGNGAGGSPAVGRPGAADPPPASTGQSGSAGGPTPPSAGTQSPAVTPDETAPSSSTAAVEDAAASSGEATGDAAEPTVADATATDDPVAGG